MTRPSGVSSALVSWLVSWLVSCLLLTTAGCVGLVGEPGGSFEDSPRVEDPRNPGQTLPAFEPVTTGLRRLTNVQYDNTIRALLGDDVDVVDEIVADPEATEEFRFSDEHASEITTSNLAAEKYDVAARAASGQVFDDTERWQTFVGCAPASASDACVTEFLTSFIRRAFRRPASMEDVETFRSVVVAGESELGSVALGLEYAVAAILQSPDFLYRVELGSGGRFDDYELATRLSYFIWDTTPDDALLASADAGELSTDEGLRAQAQRLLADPRAEPALMRFFDEWLGLWLLSDLPKNREVFPSYTEELSRAFSTEMDMLLGDIVAGDDLLSLFNTSETYVNGELARFYGVEAPGAGMGGGTPTLIERWEAEANDDGACADVPGHTNLCAEMEVSHAFDLPAGGAYRFSARVYGAQAGGDPVRASLSVDGEVVLTTDVTAEAAAPETLTVVSELSAGSHTFTVAFLNDYYAPPENRDLLVDWLSAESLDGAGGGGAAFGADFVRATLPPERRGFLAMGAMLSINAKPVDTFPTRRGLYIRTRLLCESVAPPPPEVEAMLPPLGGDVRTNRQRLTQHATDPVCAGCHSLTDPIGLAFEHFDGIGAYRETHDGATLDVTGDLDGAAFDGAAEFADILHDDVRTRDCVARQMLRHALGVRETRNQEITIIEMSDALGSSGHSIRALVESVVLSEAFRTAGEMR